MLVYKILRLEEWKKLQQDEMFAGSSDDIKDGFIHLSTVHQLSGTLERHFSIERSVIILAIHSQRLGDQLRWEVSRNGQLFPHFYGHLKTTHICKVIPLRCEDQLQWPMTKIQEIVDADEQAG
jgi:uncharacterized protein (DUF952 family)